MEGFPLILMGVVVLVSAVVYLLFMIFLPEWVGITGKTALKNEQAHREGALEGDEVGAELRDPNQNTSSDSSNSKE